MLNHTLDDMMIFVLTASRRHLKTENLLFALRLSASPGGVPKNELSNLKRGVLRKTWGAMLREADGVMYAAPSMLAALGLENREKAASIYRVARAVLNFGMSTFELAALAYAVPAVGVSRYLMNEAGWTNGCIKDRTRKMNDLIIKGLIKEQRVDLPPGSINPSARRYFTTEKGKNLLLGKWGKAVKPQTQTQEKMAA